MDFSARMTLLAASATGRATLLDQETLFQMVEAAFDTTAEPVQGPYALEVDTLDLGLEILRPTLLEGSIQITPGSIPVEVRLRVEGFPAVLPLLVDALWRGAFIARRVPQDDLVTGVDGGFTLLDLDRAIIADLGALPAAPSELEANRRTQLLARLRANSAQPNVIGANEIDRMLTTAGVVDTGALLAAPGNVGLAAFRLSFSAAVAAPPIPITLPATIAVLVRDAPLPFTTLLAESRSIRAALANDPSVQPAEALLRRRTSILVVWVIPASLLDDSDWPGVDRAARRTAAADLLRGQGIALAPA